MFFQFWALGVEMFSLTTVCLELIVPHVVSSSIGTLTWGPTSSRVAPVSWMPFRHSTDWPEIPKSVKRNFGSFHGVVGLAFQFGGPLTRLLHVGTCFHVQYPFVIFPHAHSDSPSSWCTLWKWRHVLTTWPPTRLAEGLGSCGPCRVPPWPRGHLGFIRRLHQDLFEDFVFFREGPELAWSSGSDHTHRWFPQCPIVVEALQFPQFLFCWHRIFRIHWIGGVLSHRLLFLLPFLSVVCRILCFTIIPVTVSLFVVVRISASTPHAPSTIAAFRGLVFVDGHHPLSYHDAEGPAFARAGGQQDQHGEAV